MSSSVSDSLASPSARRFLFGCVLAVLFLLQLLWESRSLFNRTSATDLGNAVPDQD